MEAWDCDVGLDVTQSFENGPDCGGFTLATHAKYVLAPGLDIEPEICKVYSLEVAGFFILLNFFFKETFPGLCTECVIWLEELPH